MTGFPGFKMNRSEGIVAFGIPSIPCADTFRAGFWMLALCACFGADGQTAVHLPVLKNIDFELPSSEAIWAKPVEQDWRMSSSNNNSGGPRSQPTFLFTLNVLLQGDSLTDDVTSFGMLSLIVGLLIHILTLERGTVLHPPPTDCPLGQVSWMQPIEKSLQSWERAWKRHPHTAMQPLDYRHGPLMADCIPFMMAACYHTYASERLNMLKDSLNAITNRRTLAAAQGRNFFDEQRGAQLDMDVLEFSTTESLAAMSAPKSDAEWTNLSRVAGLAAASLFFRAKLGFAYLSRTAPLKMGFHYVCAGFEGGQLL